MADAAIATAVNLPYIYVFLEIKINFTNLVLLAPLNNEIFKKFK